MTALLPARHHWVNTIVGILDAALHLTDEEQFVCVDRVRALLDALDIPARNDPWSIPAPLALEVQSAFYSSQMASQSRMDSVREIRHTQATDVVVPVEVWRQGLLNLILTAYPDLAGLPSIYAARELDDLLTGLGLPYRAVSHLPDGVIRANQDHEAANQDL